MKDLWGLVEYFFFIGVPGLAAKELFGAGHPILATLLLLYAFIVLLFRQERVNK